MDVIDESGARLIALTRAENRELAADILIAEARNEVREKQLSETVLSEAALDQLAAIALKDRDEAHKAQAIS